MCTNEKIDEYDVCCCTTIEKRIEKWNLFEASFSDEIDNIRVKVVFNKL